MSAARTEHTWRLLPAGTGWTAYVWLVYLLNIPLVLFLMEGASVARWLWGLGTALLFVPLYFRAYWAQGRQLLTLVAAMTALAALAVPLSPGTNVFFIYAAGAAGHVVRTRRGVQVVAGVFIAVLLHLMFALWVLEWSLAALLYSYLPPLIFVPVIGAVNIAEAARARQNAELRLAQEEVTRLAKVAERERIARDLHDLWGTRFRSSR